MTEERSPLAVRFAVAAEAAGVSYYEIDKRLGYQRGAIAAVIAG